MCAYTFHRKWVCLLLVHAHICTDLYENLVVGQLLIQGVPKKRGLVNDTVFALLLIWYWYKTIHFRFIWKLRFIFTCQVQNPFWAISGSWEIYFLLSDLCSYHLNWTVVSQCEILDIFELNAYITKLSWAPAAAPASWYLVPSLLSLARLSPSLFFIIYYIFKYYETNFYIFID